MKITELRNQGKYPLDIENGRYFTHNAGGIFIRLNNLWYNLQDNELRIIKGWNECDVTCRLFGFRYVAIKEIILD